MLKVSLSTRPGMMRFSASGRLSAGDATRRRTKTESSSANGWAADLGARVGYPLTLRVRTRYGAYETMDLTIVGLINTPNPQINKGTVFLPLSTANYYLDMDGALTEIALLPASSFGRSRDPAPMIRQINSLLADKRLDLRAHSWKELAPDYVAMAAMKSTGSRIILFLVFVIAAVGISNTMLMAVFERIRELGMMRALGMSDRQIWLAFLMEAGGIGLIGAVGGLIFGALVNWPLVEWGWDFTPLLKEMDIGYRIFRSFPQHVEPSKHVQSLFCRNSYCHACGADPHPSGP